MVAVTKDLIDVSLADATTGWSGTSGQLDTEVYKQAASVGSDGAYTYQTGKNATETCTFTPAANINMATNYSTPHLYWTMRCDVFPFCEDLNTGATNSGLMVRVTDGSGNYTQWHVSGADVWDGSWRTFVLDLTNTADVHSSSGTLSLTDVDIITFTTDNSNSGNIRIIDNTWVDAVRYGDGLQAESTTTEAFDFADIAADDALTANYYGTIQPQYGVLAAQGKITLGDATGSATTDFVSLNEQIVFQDQIVSSSHYGIVAVASATATTDISIKGLVCSSVGTTGPEIDFSDTDINSITFTDSTLIALGSITFQSGASCQRNTYVGCGQITHAGADMDGSTISGYEGTANTSALIYNVNADPDGEMDDMTFTKGTAATHAIEFGMTSPLSMTLRGCDFSGYNASNTQNDSTFHFKRTSGTVTLSLVGCSGNASYRTDGATIVISQDPVTVTVKAVTTTGVAISGARVLMEAADGTGPLPYQDSVTITRSGTTASVSHTAHGLANGKKVRIEGANEWQYNGVFAISNVTTNAYDYTIASDPGTNATGTITSTGVVVEGTTDVNGEISDSRTYSTAQPITGWSRKSSGSPYYKPGSITGTISTTAGLSTNAVMALDE